MNFIAAIVAGLFGTLAMTLLMMLAPKMGMPKMDIMGLLGSMFAADSGSAKKIGVILHLMMGVIFALIYALLWQLGLGSITWVWGLIFGLVHGLIVIMMMPVMMRMHPRPPAMASGMAALAGQMMGHLVFGLVMVLVYAAMI
ncbi:MAG: hypothetical protein GXP37_00235 [Chloroflexi bacterium]|nr:hypothetical protein [Chloroflexota bacterium]